MKTALLFRTLQAICKMFYILHTYHLSIQNMLSKSQMLDTLYQLLYQYIHYWCHMTQ